MWPLAVIEANPVTNASTGALQALKAVTVCALFLERPDHPLDHPVLLWAVRRDEFLLHPIAFDQGCVAKAGEHQPIVRSQQERFGDSAQTPITGDQGLLQRRLGCFGASTAAQVPAEQFARWQSITSARCDQQSLPAQARHSSVAQRSPGALATDGSAWIRGLKPNCKHGSMTTIHTTHTAHWAICHQPCSGKKIVHLNIPTVPDYRVKTNHGLDRPHKLLLQLVVSFGLAEVHRAPGHSKPLAHLDQANLDAVLPQSLLKAKDHFSSSLPSREASFFLARNSNIASPYADCKLASWRSYCSLMSKGLARRAFSMPFLASSTHSSISEGGEDQTTSWLLPPSFCLE